MHCSHFRPYGNVPACKKVAGLFSGAFSQGLLFDVSLYET